MGGGAIPGGSDGTMIATRLGVRTRSYNLAGGGWGGWFFRPRSGCCGFLREGIFDACFACQRFKSAWCRLLFVLGTTSPFSTVMLIKAGFGQIGPHGGFALLSERLEQAEGVVVALPELYLAAELCEVLGPACGVLSCGLLGPGAGAEVLFADAAGGGIAVGAVVEPGVTAFFPSHGGGPWGESGGNRQRQIRKSVTTSRTEVRCKKEKRERGKRENEKSY